MKSFLNRFTVAATLFAALLSIVMPSPAAAETLPNIVLILADDMGWGDIGCNNPVSKIPTPNIDRIAKEGIRLTDAHAPGSTCVPSRYGLVTGRYPMRGQIKWRMPGTVVQDDEETLGTILKRAGYKTYCSGKWHLGFDCDHPTQAGQVMPGGPSDRGFDHSFVMHASLDIPPYYYVEDGRCVDPPTDRCENNNSPGWSNIQGAFWRGGGIAPGLKHENVLPDFANKAIEYIDRHAKESPSNPMFVYFPMPAPHTPWMPLKQFQGKSKADMYGDYVVEVDDVVGRVIETLKKNDMLDNTLLIFTSDNGPVWYEADEERLGHHSNADWRGMKGDAYEGGHRMPFVARWPGKIPAGEVSDAMVSFTDFAATFAAIAADKKVDLSKLDSVNILPVLEGKAEDEGPRGEMVHYTGSPKTIRVGPWKLITQLGSCGFSKPRKENPQPRGPKGQLYNLENDPSETKNLWLEHPEIVERLTKRLEELQKK